MMKLRKFWSAFAFLAYFAQYTTALGSCSNGEVDLCCGMDGYPDPTVIRISPATWPLVFVDEFNGTKDSDVSSKWQTRKTSAYDFSGPYEGGTRNPNQNKLDIIHPWHVKLDGNGWVVFTAWEQNEPYVNNPSLNFWRTGLITTEKFDGSESFKLQPNDYIESLFILPKENGSWPALWTWNGSGGIADNDEVDSYEYHPNLPDILELHSHVKDKPLDMYFTNKYTIQPGWVVKIGTFYGENAITWYINDCRVYSSPYGTGVGTGTDFSTHIILNLSICAGQHHPPPNPEVDMMQFKVDYVKVYRPNW